MTAARQLTTSKCDPDKRDKAPQYIIVNIALGTSTTIVALSRLFFKRFIGVARKFGPDDWVVLATLIVGTPCAFINRFGLVHSGIGKDAWALGPDTVSDFAFYFDMMEVLYAAALALVRMTFIAFYFTIFTIAGSRTRTRPLLWLEIVFDALLGIISVCMADLQCPPISFYWTRYNDSSATGHYIPIEPMAWANGVLSIAFDLMIILIPLVESANGAPHSGPTFAKGFRHTAVSTWNYFELLGGFRQNELEEPKDSDIDDPTNEKSTNFGKTGGVRLNCSTLEDDAERLQHPPK
ncbi:hypothetical protein NQ176_g7650 [Zarea fungicola]|uniref:Uncharacterized protein n=1 Tax=Zarea fungicola TaxID=93591 RepID=A0ACC1MYA3_9HYPO|nr:hypothetical protein NQ176_g7650 [Lecanicillium fungicola]